MASKALDLGAARERDGGLDGVLEHSRSSLMTSHSSPLHGGWDGAWAQGGRSGDL